VLRWKVCEGVRRWRELCVDVGARYTDQVGDESR
jgi:hypothetical protein